MVDSFVFKDRYNFDDLVYITHLLRSPGGCPWDREQTHESIRRDFIEETYEVIEAINKQNPEMLCEELGDVLLQVTLHSEMETEKGVFGIDDVCDGICKKLIERHPHVFGDVTVSSTGEVLTNWDAIKKNSKHQKTQTDSMLAVPREFPALMRADKVQKKARKVGFDWDSADGAYDKVLEELNEVKDAVNKGEQSKIEEEFGDLLFSVVNVSRFIGCDSEECLTKATDKFIKRFSVVEKLAAERNIDMKNTDIQELDKLWETAKASKKE